MAMLERIKKKQWVGLKEFVESVEVAPQGQRPLILLNGILEDPRFMQWVTKNMKGFQDVLNLPTDELTVLAGSHETMPKVLAKALAVAPEEIGGLAKIFPRHFSKLREEIEFLSAVPAGEREAARNFVLKAVRKLQREEKIAGFRWELPEQEIFFDRPLPKEGPARLEFQDGKLAAEGEALKGKRVGPWKHFYDNAKLLGEGTYQEGQKTGPWRFYYGDGTPRASGRYVTDSRHGEWEEWDRNGTRRVAQWQDGKKTGEG